MPPKKETLLYLFIFHLSHLAGLVIQPSIFLICLGIFVLRVFIILEKWSLQISHSFLPCRDRGEKKKWKPYLCLWIGLVIYWHYLPKVIIKFLNNQPYFALLLGKMLYLFTCIYALLRGYIHFLFNYYIWLVCVCVQLKD